MAKKFEIQNSTEEFLIFQLKVKESAVQVVYHDETRARRLIVYHKYDKSIANCKILSAIVDRLYVYNNSIEDAEARLLFRLSDGELAKRYVEELSNWASTILPR